MVRAQRAPRISLTLLLTVMAVILGLTMVVTPLEPLTRLALLISPRDILEPKTILLLVWLKRALPLLSGATLLWLFAPRPVQISARRQAARLLHNAWTFPTILVLAYGVRLAWILVYPTQPFADSEWYYRTAVQLRDGAGFVYDLHGYQNATAGTIEIWVNGVKYATTVSTNIPTAELMAQHLRKGSPVVYDPNMAISLEGLGDVERVHRENGRTDYTDTLDLSKVVDGRFVAKAIEALGPAQ